MLLGYDQSSLCLCLQLTLEQTPAKVASEYFTKDEMVQFRKPRRKKKVRRLKADDLLGLTPDTDALDQRQVLGEINISHVCSVIYVYVNCDHLRYCTQLSPSHCMFVFIQRDHGTRRKKDEGPGTDVGNRKC